MILNSLQKFLALAACASAVAVAVTVGSATLTARADEADRFLGVVDKPVKDTGTPIRYGVTLVHLQDDYWKGMAYGIVDEILSKR